MSFCVQSHLSTGAIALYVCQADSDLLAEIKEMEVFFFLFPENLPLIFFLADVERDWVDGGTRQNQTKTNSDDHRVLIFFHLALMSDRQFDDGMSKRSKKVFLVFIPIFRFSPRTCLGMNQIALEYPTKMSSTTAQGFLPVSHNRKRLSISSSVVLWPDAHKAK